MDRLDPCAKPSPSHPLPGMPAISFSPAKTSLGPSHLGSFASMSAIICLSATGIVEGTRWTSANDNEEPSPRMTGPVDLVTGRAIDAISRCLGAGAAAGAEVGLVDLPTDFVGTTWEVLAVGATGGAGVADSRVLSELFSRFDFRAGFRGEKWYGSW